MKWVATYCKNSKFTLKIDDDVLPNTYKLINYLQETIHSSNTIICRPHVGSRVVRDPRSKFYVPLEDYSEEKFHTYCDGAAYMLSTDLAEKIFVKSLYLANFVFEDVHIGKISLALNTKLIGNVQI